VIDPAAAALKVQNFRSTNCARITCGSIEDHAEHQRAGGGLRVEDIAVPEGLKMR
jgi:hypothetical protein